MPSSCRTCFKQEKAVLLQPSAAADTAQNGPDQKNQLTGHTG